MDWVFFLFGIFCAYWAQNTGRNPWLWFFCGLFFAPITGVVLLVKNYEKAPKPDLSEPQKRALILESCFQKAGLDKDQLVKLAINRQGYSSDDGRYGVTYAADVDQCLTESNNTIPEGFVEISYWDNEQKEKQCLERQYYTAVVDYLRRNGCQELVRMLINK